MNDSGYLHRRMATTELFLRHTCEKFHTLLLSKPLRSMMTCSLAVGKVWGSLHCIHRCSMISCKWVISVSKLTSWSYKCTRIYHVYIIKKFDWLMMVNWGGGGYFTKSVHSSYHFTQYQLINTVYIPNTFHRSDRVIFIKYMSKNQSKTHEGWILTTKGLR